MILKITPRLIIYQNLTLHFFSFLSFFFFYIVMYELIFTRFDKEFDKELNVRVG